MIPGNGKKPTQTVRQEIVNLTRSFNVSCGDKVGWINRFTGEYCGLAHVVSFSPRKHEEYRVYRLSESEDGLVGGRYDIFSNGLLHRVVGIIFVGDEERMLGEDLPKKSDSITVAEILFEGLQTEFVKTSQSIGTLPPMSAKMLVSTYCVTL